VTTNVKGAKTASNRVFSVALGHETGARILYALKEGSDGAAHLAGDVLLHDFLVFLLDVLQRRLNLARLAGVLKHAHVYTPMRRGM
jgi:hypothetical protein